MLRSRGFNVLAGATSKLYDHGHILTATKLHLDSDNRTTFTVSAFRQQIGPFAACLGRESDGHEPEQFRRQY